MNTGMISVIAMHRMDVRITPGYEFHCACGEPITDHPAHLAEKLTAAGYSKADHVEYAADHKHADLEFTDEDGDLFTDRDYFEDYFEEYGNVTLMQRTVGPWEPLNREAEASR